MDGCRTRCSSRCARRRLSHFDDDDLRRMLGETAQGIADGAPLPALSPAEGAGGDHASSAAGAHPLLHRDGDAVALDAPAGCRRRARPGAERRPRGEHRRRARRRSDPHGAHHRIRAVGRDRRDRGPAGVRADRADGPPARPHRGHPRRDGARAVARATLTESRRGPRRLARRASRAPSASTRSAGARAARRAGRPGRAAAGCSRRRPRRASARRPCGRRRPRRAGTRMPAARRCAGRRTPAAAPGAAPRRRSPPRRA